jgi:CHAT domain-containing protein/Tfp pilus assembly protein PilF
VLASSVCFGAVASAQCAARHVAPLIVFGCFFGTPNFAGLLAFAAPPTTSKAKTDEVPQRLEEARASHAKGSLREARSIYESLLPALRNEQRNLELAAALTALAEIASAQGEYDVAVARASEAAAVYHNLGDKRGEARAQNHWGAAELHRGDYPAALAQLQQALALSLSAGDREGEAEQLSNIGHAFYYQGKYMEAWRAYQREMEVLDQVGNSPSGTRNRQLAIADMATLFQRLGREDRALELYEQLRNSPLAVRPSEQARLLANLGVLYRHLGDPVKALQTYRQAQDLYAREQHAQGQIGVLRNIGIVLALDLGDLSGAIQAFSRALKLAEDTNDRLLATHAHLYRAESLFRLDQLEAAGEDFEAALATSKERGTSEEEWKSLYGLGRVAHRAGNNDLAREYLRKAVAVIESVRSELQLSTLRAEFLGDKRDVYDALIELLLQKSDAPELFQLMERSRARAFQDRLQEAPRKGPSMLDSPLTLSAVQSRLGESTVLLELWATSQRAAVVWVSRDAFGIVPKHLSAEDHRRISSFLSNISDDSGDGWKNESQVLGELLLSGVTPIVRGDIHHLLIVPDGILNLMPFEVLRTGAPSAFLLERFDISYLPTAAMLVRGLSPEKRSWRFPWDRQLVAFGDPMVSTQSAAKAPAGLVEEEILGRLPKSAEEVRAIARMVQGRAEIHLGGDDLKKYLLQGRATGVPMLHLSTHATADLDNPERSRVLFSPENSNEGLDYLFLKEIYNLDLQGVELTTLSACDTERGKMVRGEGAQGFSRALLSAGARTTVTSLWRVADQPTAELMKQFYFALGQGKPRAEALRQAKLKFLHSGTALQHPRHWAAFVLSGDGLEALPRAISWGTLLMPLAVGLLLLGVAARRRL